MNAKHALLVSVALNFIALVTVLRLLPKSSELPVAGGGSPALREYFAKRGVTVGASGLAVVISANAVQAAPAGLAVTIYAASALTGTSLAPTATVTITKASSRSVKKQIPINAPKSYGSVLSQRYRVEKACRYGNDIAEVTWRRRLS